VVDRTPVHTVHHFGSLQIFQSRLCIRFAWLAKIARATVIIGDKKATHLICGNAEPRDCFYGKKLTGLGGSGGLVQILASSMRVPM
jgi:hypothetical protein